MAFRVLAVIALFAVMTGFTRQCRQRLEVDALDVVENGDPAKTWDDRLS